MAWKQAADRNPMDQQAEVRRETSLLGHASQMTLSASRHLPTRMIGRWLTAVAAVAKLD